jgi:hypothetical protein
MLCNTDSAQDASSSFLHPHDPSVEREYENLIRAWKQQLIGQTPPTPSNDYIRFAWMRLMDHYLDQQWLDSKQMMQCAQAWSARESISLTEAVHTMNILSLKSMQRSLDARQELLQALGDPDFMVGFGVSPIQEEDEDERSSLAGSEDHEDQIVHAPLLVKHNTTPAEEIMDEAIVTTENKQQEEELIHLYAGQKCEEVKSRSAYEEETDGVPKRPRLLSSASTPNISLVTNQQEFADDSNEFSRKCESYYQQLPQASSWKETSIKQDKDDDRYSDNQSLCSVSIHSGTNNSSPPLGSGVQWKSWFLEDQNDQTAAEYPLLSIHPTDNHHTSIIFEEDFADEKVETDASFSGMYTTNNTSYDLLSIEKKTQPFLMVRSESSISAFRPISNNLAPRCQPILDPIANSYPLQRSSSTSYSGPKERLMMIPKSKPTTAAATAPTITKSKSFPSKAALPSSSSLKKSYASSPPPMPPKERNFMIRSIVSKKASLSKLFGSKK